MTASDDTACGFGPGTPGFTEGWQATGQALLHVLQTGGRISAGDWADRLGAERAAQAAAGQDAYFDALATALEGMVTESGLVTRDLLDRRAEAWRRAYERTPHGQPVHLDPADSLSPDDHPRTTD